MARPLLLASYELGEISHIENALRGEARERSNGVDPVGAEEDRGGCE